MPVVIREFEVVQEQPQPQAAAPAEPQGRDQSADAAALERMLSDRKRRALRVRAY